MMSNIWRDWYIVNSYRTFFKSHSVVNDKNWIKNCLAERKKSYFTKTTHIRTPLSILNSQPADLIFLSFKDIEKAQTTRVEPSTEGT